MDDNVTKVIGMLASVAVVGMFLFWYMSPYQQCVRTLTAEKNTRPAVVCLRLMNRQ